MNISYMERKVAELERRIRILEEAVEIAYLAGIAPAISFEPVLKKAERNCEKEHGYSSWTQD